MMYHHVKNVGHDHIRQIHTTFAACAGLWIVAVDAIFRWFSPSLLLAAILDEAAHFATTLLFVLPLLTRISRHFLAGALMSTVLIDIDHIPARFGLAVMAEGDARPPSHSLLTVIVVIVLALILQGRGRQVLLGIGFGVMTHLVRDMATGGLPFWWPISADNIRFPYAGYAALILGLITLLFLPTKEQPVKH